MYNVIIVDDEAIIRKGFASFIPWNEIGYNVTAEFMDGAPAIEFMKNNPVDLVLTDIKMANVSGIEVAKYAYENLPNTRVCIISGYKDFEYAQTAIKYNVEYFLTKPTVIDEAIEIMKEIKLKLDAQTQIEKQKSEYKELIEIARQQFFTDIFLGNFESKQSIIEKAEYLNLIDEQTIYCPFWVIVSDCENYVNTHWNYGKEYFFTAVCNFINDNNHMFRLQKILITSDEILLIASTYYPENIDEFKTQIEAHLSAAKQSIKCMMDLNIDYQIGRVFANILELVDFLSEPVWVDNNSFSGSSVTLIDDKVHLMLLEKYKNVILSIILGRNEQLYNNLTSITGILTPFPLSVIKDSINDFLNIIFSKLSNISNKNFLHIYKNSLEDIQSSDNRNAVFSICETVLNSLITQIDKNVKDDSSERMIERAKEFIENNYSNDISLDDVANYIFLNSTYFSRFFKHHTGENFRDYLINLRISKAIALLMEGKYKIYEIGSMTGYKNSKYFNHQFKQVTGQTPKEYVMKHSGKNGD